MMKTYAARGRFLAEECRAAKERFKGLKEASCLMVYVLPL
jgi:hypothetical protein